MRYSCSGTTGRKVKGKGKGHPRTGHEGPEGEQIYSSTLPSTSALDGGGWSAPRPGRFTAGKDPLPIVQEAGLAPGPVWTGAENLATTGIRSRTVQPVASRYTDWAIAAPFLWKKKLDKSEKKLHRIC